MGCFLVLLLVPVCLVHARLAADRPALATRTGSHSSLPLLILGQSSAFFLQLLLAACAPVCLLLGGRVTAIYFAFFPFVHLDG